MTTSPARPCPRAPASRSSGTTTPTARRSSRPTSLRRILAALGLPADTRGDLAASRRLLAKRATLADLPPLVTATAGRPTRLDLGAADPRPAKLMLERGAPATSTLTPARGRLRIPAVAEIGYHRLEIGEREVVARGRAGAMPHDR